MFAKHVTKNLSAYCHGEVTPEESRQISEHLLSCNRCRQQFEEIKLGVKLAERLPQLAAPDSLWPDLQSRLVAENNKSRVEATKEPRWSFKFWQASFAGAAAGLLVVAGLVGFWIYARESRPFWEVARLNGAPKIGSSNIGERGKLGVGEWLETDNASRAQIDVGSIGQVDIDPNTRVRLVETKPTEHRLELARGKMSARIWAPPRLFFVDTPSAVAADLGCAYTLEVDDAGRGLLKVTSGWVALQLTGHESMVPAGATCAMRPGIGPGTPYFEDASETFRRALSNFDFDPRAESRISTLDVLLHEARPRDSLTLWHLLARVEGNDRVRVYERLAGFVPPPAGVTREGVLQLNEQMLQLWKDKLEITWTGESWLHKRAGSLIRAVGKVRGLVGKK
jgi:predicted anti-sigma-YlaC factor YlaD